MNTGERTDRASEEFCHVLRTPYGNKQLLKEVISSGRKTFTRAELTGISVFAGCGEVYTVLVFDEKCRSEAEQWLFALTGVEHDYAVSVEGLITAAIKERKYNAAMGNADATIIDRLF